MAFNCKFNISYQATPNPNFVQDELYQFESMIADPLGDIIIDEQ